MAIPNKIKTITCIGAGYVGGPTMAVIFCFFIKQNGEQQAWTKRSCLT